MKRVVSLVAALALAVGAFAPAAFASDAGYGQTDLIPLEDLDQETFDTYLSKFYSQDYPTYGVLDLIRDTFQGGLANASGLNDSPWSWALDLVDNASDLGTEVGLWLTGVKIDPNTGKVIYPDDYLTDYAKQQLDTQLKFSGSFSPPSPSDGSGWVHLAPYIYDGWYIWGNPYGSKWAGDVKIVMSDVYVSGIGTVGSSTSSFCVCSLQTGNFYVKYWNGGLNDNANSLGAFSTSETITGNGYKYGSSSLNLGLTASYTSAAAAASDFYGNGSFSGGQFNGDGYYSDHQEGFSINLPSLPSTNWGNLSKYYYTTYGDEIVEGDVDRYYYNIANNYAPYSVSYELPYWLINGSTNVLDFNYDLELPTADLYSVPSDFDGGSGFWDKAFSSLGGFGAFIMLGLSFGLVSLFFKD